MFDVLAVIVGIILLINSVRNSDEEKNEKNWLERLNEIIAENDRKNQDSEIINKDQEISKNQESNNILKESQIENINNENINKEESKEFNFQETDEYKEYMKLLYESESLFDYERNKSEEINFNSRKISKNEKNKFNKNKLDLRKGVIYKEILDKPKALKGLK